MAAKRTLDIPVNEVVPAEDAVLRALGGPRDRGVGPRVKRLLTEAATEFRAEAEPRGVFDWIDAGTFAEVYAGEGDNESPSPLEEIFPKAEALALFAVTVGARVSDRIVALFEDGQVALGATLDALASEGAELAGTYLERVVLDDARSEGEAGATSSVLCYSPGYCGWNITGQKALFAALGPEEIGIRLSASCLMVPLKSISGVAVVGPAEIHEFTNDYRFCTDCRTRNCQDRIRALKP
jgi:hypothetical protein